MTSLIGRVLAAVLVSASLTACAHDRTVGAAPGIEVADLAQLPACLAQRCWAVSVGPGQHTVSLQAEDQGCLWDR